MRVSLKGSTEVTGHRSGSSCPVRTPCPSGLLGKGRGVGGLEFVDVYGAVIALGVISAPAFFTKSEADFTLKP